MGQFGGDDGKNTVRGFYIVLGIAIAAVVVWAAYHSLRNTAARMSRDFTSPFLSGARYLEDRISDAALLATSKPRLVKELLELRKRNLELSAENSRLKTSAEENKSLRLLKDLPEGGRFNHVTVEVLSRSPSLWRERFVINRGANSGIGAGDLVAVPTPEGLAAVGRVREVSLHTGVVATLFSDDCRLSVRIDGSEFAGALEYNPATGCPTVKYLPLSTELSPGDRVVTSGFTENTPPGIPVGLAAARPDGKTAISIRGGMHSELEVKPFVSMADLRFAVVFTRRR